LLLLALIIIWSFSPVSGQEDQIRWPNGAKAAVCLTYDDGIATHLDIAIPDLDKEDLKGTFYLQGTNIFPDRVERWRQAAANGHELGNHTIFHPCSKNLDFVWEEFSTEKYTVRRMIRELEVMNHFLFSIDGLQHRSYAYTCGETEVGGTSFVDSLHNSGLFNGARGGMPVVVKNMRELNLFEVPSLPVLDSNSGELIPFVEEAGKAGGLAVFMFHGVGGDYLEVSREGHYSLLQFLNENREQFWTAPFREVMQHILNERKRLNWE